MKRLLGVAAKLLVSVALIGLFLRQIDFADVEQAARTARLSFLLLAVLLFTISNLLGAVQWGYLLRVQEIDLPPRRILSGKMLSSNGRCIKDPVIMASLDVQNTANTALQPAKVSKIDRSAKAKKITARVLYLKKARAKRKWRRNRYALGGPRYKKRRFSRRYSRRHYIRRRKNAWIRDAFGE